MFKPLRMIFLCLLSLLINPHPVNSSSVMLCHEDESSALLAFKNSMVIDYSNEVTLNHPTRSWKNGTDCCEWYGITCHPTSHHVVQLDLHMSGLIGSLHSNSTLFLLRHLGILVLSWNDFSYSPISPLFGLAFPNLTHLDLSGSNFSGEVPLEFSQLSQLQTLCLASSDINLLKMSNINNIIANMTQLTYLLLDGVNLDSTSFSPSLTNLSSLTDISLAECNLRGDLPFNLLNLPQLQYLNLGNNKGLHAHFSLSNWSSTLQFIVLSSVNFSSKLPSSSPALSPYNKLEGLYLSGCNFQGQIPTWVWNISTGSIPRSLGNLTLLNCLDLSSNKLTGQIPQELTSLTALGVFNVSENQLVGPIPRGKQFNTFSANSYKGNLELCGFPLPECGRNGRPRRQKSKGEQRDDDSEDVSILSEWKVIMMGYGFGTIVGFAWGYHMLSIGRPFWLLKLVYLIELIPRNLFGRRRRRPTRGRN